jgi:nucleoid-associated protein YgaU
MTDNLGRVFTACAVLAGIWVLVYWWWTPSEPRIRFGDTRAVEVAEAPAEVREPDPRPPPRQPQLPEPQPAVIAPQFREYTIRQGDTLTQIARRELGSASYAEAISRANPFVNLDQVRPGRVIRIPLDPGNIQGIPVAGAPLPAPPGQVAEEVMAEYTVRPGDTLSRIAQSQYGSTRYATLIFEANRDQLRSMNEVRVGQRLRLPPKPD